MQLTINNQETIIATTANLPRFFDIMRKQEFSEMWLAAGENGPSLAMLVHAERAWLMYLPDHEGSSGCTSRNLAYDGPSDAVTDFMLANGQRDVYPAAWTIPLEVAWAACEYFIETQGGRSPRIAWHDDAANDQE